MITLLERQRTTAGACFLALILLGGPAAGDGAEPEIPVEEYTVLGAVLAHGLGDQLAGLVIAGQTTGTPAQVSKDSPTLEVLAQTLELPAEALSDWITKNRRRFDLAASLPLAQSYTVLHTQELLSLFASDHPEANWRRFYDRHPDAPGLVRVSRVGLQPDLSHAVVYVEFECGAGCGSGRLVHLSSDDTRKWQVVGGELIWVATD